MKVREPLIPEDEEKEFDDLFDEYFDWWFEMLARLRKETWKRKRSTRTTGNRTGI